MLAFISILLLDLLDKFFLSVNSGAGATFFFAILLLLLLDFLALSVLYRSNFRRKIALHFSFFGFEVLYHFFKEFILLYFVTELLLKVVVF